MNEGSGAPSAVSLPGGNGEVAVSAAIDAALGAAPGELPGRVALVRRHTGTALDAPRAAAAQRSKAITQMIVRDVSRDEP
jgi:hypothetical protein